MRVAGFLLVVLLFLLHRPALGADQQAKGCVTDRVHLLNEDFWTFDQVQDDGWRAVAKMDGCQEAAAQLIDEYAARHPERAQLLYWHRGQILAIEGDYARAIAAMEKS